MLGFRIFPYSKYIGKLKNFYGFHDDPITKVNDDGKILYIKSISELLLENRILN